MAAFNNKDYEPMPWNRQYIFFLTRHFPDINTFQNLICRSLEIFHDPLWYVYSPTELKTNINILEKNQINENTLKQSKQKEIGLFILTWYDITLLLSMLS